MKHFTYLILIGLLFSLSPLSLLSQYCFNGNEDIYLFSQTQIDGFSNNCDEIAGNIYISGEEITNLNGFSNITDIGWDLVIEDCPDLTDISGLSNLTFMGRDLVIRNNASLESLDGLNGLSHLVRIFIEDNPSLITLDGLNNLRSVTLDFIVENNPSLKDISALGNLEEITGVDFSYSSGNLSFISNDSLSGLSNLKKLKKLRHFNIIDNDNIGAIVELDSLDTIFATLKIIENDHLEWITGFDSLKYVGDALELKGNPNLRHVEGFNLLDTIHGDFIIETASIEQFIGFNSLNIAMGDLDLGILNRITDLNGFPKLEKIYGDLSISSCEILENVSAFSKLDTVFGEISFSNNAMQSILFNHSGPRFIGGNLNFSFMNSMDDISGLDSLNTIGKDLFISFNPNIKDLNGLSQVRVLDGGMNLSFNGSLENLDGLDGIKSLGGSLDISWNGSLENLDGLDNIETVNGSIILISNNSLTNIAGLSNINPETINILDPEENDIEILSNTALSDCSIKLICDLISLPESELRIEGNSSGCQSFDEVMNNCIPGPECTTLSFPSFGSEDIDRYIDVEWVPNSEAEGYLINMGTTMGNWNIANLLDVSNDTSFDPGELPCGTEIFVQIQPYSGSTVTNDCPVESFTTEAVEASISEDIVICYPEGEIIEASGGNNYHWSPIEGLSDPNIANPLANPIQPTIYQCIVSNENNCSDTVHVFVESIATTVELEQIVNFSNDQQGSINISILSTSINLDLEWSGPDNFYSNEEDITDLFPGCYELTIMTDQDCLLDTVFCIEDLSSGINFVSENSAYCLFPNPCDQELFIHFDDNILKSDKIFVYDFLGSLIKEHFVGQADYLISIGTSGFQDGFYLIKMNLEGQIKSIPFSVIHKQ